jgi:hypothetical protein
MTRGGAISRNLNKANLKLADWVLAGVKYVARRLSFPLNEEFSALATEGPLEAKPSGHSRKLPYLHRGKRFPALSLPCRVRR